MVTFDDNTVKHLQKMHFQKKRINFVKWYSNIQRNYSQDEENPEIGKNIRKVEIHNLCATKNSVD